MNDSSISFKEIWKKKSEVWATKLFIGYHGIKKVEKNQTPQILMILLEEDQDYGTSIWMNNIKS